MQSFSYPYPQLTSGCITSVGGWQHMQRPYWYVEPFRITQPAMPPQWQPISTITIGAPFVNDDDFIKWLKECRQHLMPDSKFAPMIDEWIAKLEAAKGATDSE